MSLVYIHLIFILLSLLSSDCHVLMEYFKSNVHINLIRIKNFDIDNGFITL
jgi:hypothetical protein